ncbi:hypothetical protein FQA39_LY18350 [Lamprigera yunnana]|nr:hypothetical protein FQA39_LY18350 [Lamprigera yunnana]
MDILEVLENGIFLPNPKRGDDEEVLLINNYLAFLKKIIEILTVLPCIVISVPILLWYFGITHNKWPFSIFSEIVNLEISVGIQILVQIITLGGYYFNDILYFIFLSHANLHLTNLQNCIKNVIKRSILDYLKENKSCSLCDFEKIEWKYLRRRLKEIIEYHKAIYEVTKEIDNAFNISQFVHFLSISVVTCFVLYDLSVVSEINGVLWMDILFILFLLSEVTAFCFFANEITTLSFEVGHCCSNLDFVGTDIRFQKSLLAIIRRSQNPIVFTAGKIIPLTMATALGVRGVAIF